jgi:hypothetical protein
VERQADGRRLVAIRASLIGQLANGTDVRRLALQGERDGMIELGGRETLEQLVEALSMAAEIAASLGDDLQQFSAVGRSLVDAIEGAMLTRPAFHGLQPLDVLWIFNLLGAVPRASMAGYQRLTVEDAHLVEGCDDSHGAADAVVRDGIVVEVEAGVGSLSDFHSNVLVGGKSVIRQRNEARLLLGEHLSHQPFAVFGARPVRGLAGAPGMSLPIEVGEVAKGASREEGVANVANGALDASLFVAASGGYRLCQEAIVTRKLEQSGMKADRVARALENRALQIVIKQLARDAAERS